MTKEELNFDAIAKAAFKAAYKSYETAFDVAYEAALDAACEADEDAYNVALRSGACNVVFNAVCAAEREYAANKINNLNTKQND